MARFLHGRRERRGERATVHAGPRCCPHLFSFQSATVTPELALCRWLPRMCPGPRVPRYLRLDRRPREGAWVKVHCHSHHTPQDPPGHPHRHTTLRSTALPTLAAHKRLSPHGRTQKEKIKCGRAQTASIVGTEHGNISV